MDPRFVLPVQLYYMAAVDRRAGMCGSLIGTLEPANALAIIDLYAEHLPTAHDRQRVYELMLMLDEIATRQRSQREAAARERAAKKK